MTAHGPPLALPLTTLRVDLAASHASSPHHQGYTLQACVKESITRVSPQAFLPPSTEPPASKKACQFGLDKKVLRVIEESEEWQRRFDDLPAVVKRYARRRRRGDGVCMFGENSVCVSAIESGTRVPTVQQLVVGTTVFKHGETCLFGNGVASPAPRAGVLEAALRQQNARYHKGRTPLSSAFHGPTIRLCGRCLGVLHPDDDEDTCSFQWDKLVRSRAALLAYLMPASSVNTESVAVYRVGMMHASDESQDFAKAALYVMGWLLGLSADNSLDDLERVCCPIFVLTLGERASPVAAWELPESISASVTQPRSFLEAVAVLQRPCGTESLGSSIVDFIIGCARQMGYFQAGPSYPSTVFFPPGWALLMSALRKHLCSPSGELWQLAAGSSRTFWRAALVDSYRGLGTKLTHVSAEVPMLFLRFGFFEALLRWPPKSESPSPHVFDPLGLANPNAEVFHASLACPDEDQEDQGPFAAALAAASSCSSALALARAWEGKIAAHDDECSALDRPQNDFKYAVMTGSLTLGALCGVILGTPTPCKTLRAATPSFFRSLERSSASVLRTSLRGAIAQLRKLDKDGAFCDPVSSPARMCTVIQLHERLQYLALASAHFSTDVELGATPECRALRYSMLAIFRKVLKFSATEVLPTVLDDLGPWRMGCRYWANLQLGLGRRFPVDRPALAMLRKIQIYTSVWGAAVLLHETVLPDLCDEDVPRNLRSLLTIVVNGWLPHGPCGAQPGDQAMQRLALIVGRLRG